MQFELRDPLPPRKDSTPPPFHTSAEASLLCRSPKGDLWETFPPRKDDNCPYSLQFGKQSDDLARRRTSGGLVEKDRLTQLQNHTQDIRRFYQCINQCESNTVSTLVKMASI